MVSSVGLSQTGMQFVSISVEHLLEQLRTTLEGLTNLTYADDNLLIAGSHTELD